LRTQPTSPNGATTQRPPSASTGTTSDDDITPFLSAWCDAERTRDIAFLDAHLADDFIGVGPLGFTLPKQARIARHKGDDLRYETFALDEVIVRSYGQVAVVTARQDAVGTFQNTPRRRSCATPSC
jgi:ketosteroid isomerase-like protein